MKPKILFHPNSNPFSSITPSCGTRIYVRQRNANSFRKDDEKKSDAGAVRKDGSAENEGTKIGLDKSLTRARSVRRRKSKETSRDSSVHTSEDEKNTIFTSSFNNDLIDKSALTEEKPKEIEVDSVISRHAAECCSSSSNEPCLVLRPEIHHHDDEGSRKFGGDVEVESSEGTDEEDEQEREANKKAVQWTETDQKNLMDLGFSEIERNKRLESLIARRRARKLLSLQVRRPVINIDSFETHGPMTTLMIPRGNSNPFLASQSVGNYSPMPGSAPSVLLPNQNPFDLPYDPQEERPNLTGGSFHQEFQDITFTRPENVGLRPLSPSSRELKEDQQQEEASLPHDLTKEGGFSEGLENSKVEGQLGNVKV
ncbi:hypothetical protein M9H77_05985 [Catharanthus roseus]|uniref:Uncharacterized protein n=1 Tax=Catharanthus roseus TaxID=4058 RepID=A0ACC0BQT4_CATRO|nr:hypothetical protein M9H77_05985 [Catharanthus roseus]